MRRPHFHGGTKIEKQQLQIFVSTLFSLHNGKLVAPGKHTHIQHTPKPPQTCTTGVTHTRSPMLLLPWLEMSTVQNEDPSTLMLNCTPGAYKRIFGSTQWSRFCRGIAWGYPNAWYINGNAGSMWWLLSTTSTERVHNEHNFKRFKRLVGLPFLCTIIPSREWGWAKGHGC